MTLYMSAETNENFEYLRSAWGLTGERQQGQVIARALQKAVDAEMRRKK